MSCRTLATLLLTALVLASCAAQPAPLVPDAPGFWYGVLHGLIAPVTLIVSLFKEGVRIYAFPNGGWWYDFGFFLGFAAACGGGTKISIRRS